VPAAQGIRAASPGYWSPQASRLYGTKSAQSLSATDQGRAAHGIPRQVLKCSECGAEFVFTAGEQMFFADKGFKTNLSVAKAARLNEPRRGGGGGHASPMRSETKTNCSQCGKETTVPFRPRKAARVLRECFQQRRAMGAA